MKLRTELEVGRAGRLLNPEESVVLIGSCFTDSVGQRMRSHCWRAYPNPTGVLYNPASIASALRLTLSDEAERERLLHESIASRDLGKDARLWSCWHFDSGCSSFSESETLERGLGMVRELEKQLREASVLIFTFGTAWVYELVSRPGFIVGNCHKFPASDFRRRRLSIDGIVGEWSGLIEELRRRYGDKRIIFTVSPIRHLKDGFEGNTRSKAVLQLSCEAIVEECGNTEYFPAYELLNDDLRDYRFYASDLVHPSEEAVEYIWEKFCDRYLSAESRQLLSEAARLRRALLHKPNLACGGQIYERLESSRLSQARQNLAAFLKRHPGMTANLSFDGSC